MKIFYSELFEDYFFLDNGKLVMMLQPSSLNRDLWAWALMPIDYKKLDFICEINNATKQKENK